ncbi:MAG: hypothetical protein ABI947_20270 [Chloroflexota bacterium]
MNPPPDNPHMPPERNHRANIDQAIKATRAVIEEAVGYIERQEDGPLTMRFALRDIEQKVDLLETEACCALVTLDEMNEIALTLREQRDEAIRQYEVILSLFGLPNMGSDQL